MWERLRRVPSRSQEAREGDTHYSSSMSPTPAHVSILIISNSSDLRLWRPDISPGHLFKELLRAKVAWSPGRHAWLLSTEVTSPCPDQELPARSDLFSTLPSLYLDNRVMPLLCDLQYFLPVGEYTRPCQKEHHFHSPVS